MDLRACVATFREDGERDSRDRWCAQLALMTWECALGFGLRQSRFAPSRLGGKLQEKSFSVSRQRSRLAGARPGIDRRSAAKTLLCNNNDFHLRPMCIIFGMIERNVACCHACLRPYGTARQRLAHLQNPSDERKTEEVRYWRTFPHQTTVLGTKLPLLIYLLLFSTYYLSSPNSRRSPSARSSLRSRPIFSSFSSSSCSSSLRRLLLLLLAATAAGVELAMEVPPSPSRPIPLPQRRRTFPRNRSTVHQFRRDVVARSLEENYRVQG